MKETLFGHLARRFAAHPEVLATEALHYTLGRSATATDRLQASEGSSSLSFQEPPLCLEVHEENRQGIGMD